MLPHPGGTGSCWQLWPAGQSPPQKLSCPPQWSGPRHAQCPFPSSPHVWLSGQSPPQNDAGFPPQFGTPSVVVVGHGSLVLVVVVVTVQQKPTASGVRVTSAGRHASRIFTVVLKVPSRPRWAHSTAAWAAAVNKRIAVTARAKRRGAAIRRTSYAPGASCQSREALCHPPRKAAHCRLQILPRTAFRACSDATTQGFTGFQRGRSPRFPLSTSGLTREQWLTRLRSSVKAVGE